MPAQSDTTIDSPASAEPARAHPLGPVILRYSPVNRSASRGRALLVAAGCAVLLGVALWLTPDASGMGTHRQLGLYRCTWPTMLGIPCPTCGMTTAYAYFVRGRLISAFHAQPLGFLLAVATLGVLVLSLREAFRGRALRINWYRVRPRYVVIGIVLLALAGWGYKILAFRAGMG